MHETCWGATQRRRAHYRHETPLPLAFHMMVMADAFVMSRSSLSMAAALLSNGTVAFLSAERRLTAGPALVGHCRAGGVSAASGQLPSKWAALELFTTCNMHIGTCTCPSVPRYKSFSHCSHMFDHMLGMFITNISQAVRIWFLILYCYLSR